MKISATILPLIALAGLSACGQKEDEKHGTSVSINAKDMDGDVKIAADGQTGKVSVNIPGFKADVKLPKIALDSNDFELDGVKLYPESKIRGVNVNADDTGGQDKSRVHIAFDSPATAPKVKAWFRERFTDKGFAFSETPTGFSGKTDDGDAFTVTLTAKGVETDGAIDITG